MNHGSKHFTSLHYSINIPPTFLPQNHGVPLVLPSQHLVRQGGSYSKLVVNRVSIGVPGLSAVQHGDSHLLGAGDVTKTIGVVSGAVAAYHQWINVGAIELVSTFGTDCATRAFQFFSFGVLRDSSTD